MLINQEFADTISEEHGQEGLDELLQALQNTMVAVSGFETDVVNHFVNRPDLFYAPLYNTSVAVH